MVRPRRHLPSKDCEIIKSAATLNRVSILFQAMSYVIFTCDITTAISNVPTVSMLATMMGIPE